MGQHHRFHAGATQFIDRRAAGAGRHAGLQAGLTRRALLEAGRQYAAHDDLFHIGALDTGAADGLAHGNGAQFNSAERRQAALEAAHRGACTTDNDDIVIGHAVTPE